MMQEKSYYLAFSNFPGIGPIKFEKLIKTFGSAKSSWNASIVELGPIIGKTYAEKFETFRQEFDIKKYESELLKKKISYVCLNEKEYPERLKKIKNPPIILFVRGKINFNSEQKFIAIVGTRKISNYGRSVTEMFAGSLAESGLVIVSGLAIGVDSAAHVACLESGGKTIAVLGNGVDKCYPRENQKIYDDILKNNGVIVSEFPMGEPPNPGNFPSRNRIIAGLSDGVLVTEGASDSGSLITADYGLKFGRKVFAVPGPITSSLSAAPLRLIEKGAKLVITPEDITRELGISHFAKASRDKKNYVGLTKEESSIVKLLENEPLLFDEIVRRLKFDSSKTGTLLSMMEIKGLIKSSGGAYSVIV